MGDFEHLHRIASLLRGFTGRWGFCGGWAIDLFVGRVGREHADVDIAVLRCDQLELQARLAGQGWAWQKVDGDLQPWPAGQFLELPVHELWARRAGHEPQSLEFLLNEAADGQFHFRRDRRAACNLADAFLPAAEGLPILAPDVVLLYKSSCVTPTNDGDLGRALPHLSPRQRQWLKASLKLTAPGHPWLGRL